MSVFVQQVCREAAGRDIAHGFHSSLGKMPRALKSPRKKIPPLRHIDDYSGVVLAYSGSAKSLLRSHTDILKCRLLLVWRLIRFSVNSHLSKKTQMR